MIALIALNPVAGGLLYVDVSGRGEIDRIAIRRKNAMKFSGSTVRLYMVGVLAASAAGVAAASIAAPPATAAPSPCTAAGLASTVSSVTAAAGQYLEAHPDTNDAFTQAGNRSDAEASLRSYFVAHPGQYNDLRAIARPLSDLRAQCNSNIGAGQISALIQAFS
jgi:hemophore-related protein